MPASPPPPSGVRVRFTIEQFRCVDIAGIDHAVFTQLSHDEQAHHVATAMAACGAPIVGFGETHVVTVDSSESARQALGYAPTEDAILE
jgi:hypothetical protein